MGFWRGGWIKPRIIASVTLGKSLLAANYLFALGAAVPGQLLMMIPPEPQFGLLVGYGVAYVPMVGVSYLRWANRLPE